jgi:hypothetical protein
MSIAGRDAEAYITPGPKYEAGLRIGFAPNTHLDTALRGFLLPERRIEDETEREKAMGAIVLKTKNFRRLGFDQSDNTGLVFRPSDAKELHAEEKRLRRNDVQQEQIAVGDIGLEITKEHDIVVDLLLLPTEAQRQKLGGFVLSKALRERASKLIVFAAISHTNIEMDGAGVLQYARQIKRNIYDDRRRREEDPLAHPSPLYYVQKPVLMSPVIIPLVKPAAT